MKKKKKKKKWYKTNCKKQQQNSGLLIDRLLLYSERPKLQYTGAETFENA